jgi:hypothetical protein
MVGRSGRAAKYWEEAAKKNSDEENKKKIAAAASDITKLTKDAKTVLKDLAACAKDATDAKLAAYSGSGKDFREKVAMKRLASAKKLEADGMRFVNGLKNILPGGGGLWPGMNDVDPKVTVESLTNFSHYWNEMRIELAKLK